MVINNTYVPAGTPLEIIGVENIKNEINLLIGVVGLPKVRQLYPCPPLVSEKDAVYELWESFSTKNPYVFARGCEELDIFQEIDEELGIECRYYSIPMGKTHKIILFN